jgi:hypothetical protein
MENLSSPLDECHRSFACLIQDISIGAKLTYKPSFEKLTERLALAIDVGAFFVNLCPKQSPQPNPRYTPLLR